MKTRLNQVATYWAPGKQDQFGAQRFPPPVLLRCFWTDMMENIIDTKGDTIVSKAQIYLDSVVEPLGYLYLGETDAQDPTQTQGAWLIHNVGSAPNLSNLQRIYTAYI